jgi:tRNA(fMet)-specific endonuclease VapC
MSQYILDSDHVSLWLRQDDSVRAKLAQSPSQVVTTIVTAQELFNGWVVRINDPAQSDNLVELYTYFWNAVDFLRDVQVLNFDDSANAVYQRLLQDHSQLRKHRLQKDIRISAIALPRTALSVGGIVVTRNQRDFSQVPGLRWEDWAV